MDFWNQVVHSSILGVAKKPLDTSSLDQMLAEPVAKILSNESIDNEERFLQIATLCYNFRAAAHIPIRHSGEILEACRKEDKLYCSSLAETVLKDILAEENVSLLLLWLKHCAAKEQLVPVALIPSLLNLGIHHKSLQPLIVGCCGYRGEWLAVFNPEWRFSVSQSDETIWETGSLDQRKQVLINWRQKEPGKGLKNLQTEWTKEDAATRQSLLETLSINLSENDIPFLESLVNDKSKKVKEQAIYLLTQIPGSAIVTSYEQLLSQSISLKKDKAFLGMVNKTSLNFHLQTVPDSMVKTGIDKLSPNKELTDDEYILGQLVQRVPPDFWERHLSLEPPAIIDLFQKDPQAKKLFSNLVMAVTHFNDSRWAIALMQHSTIFYIDIIPLIPVKQQEYYSNRYFKDHAESIISHALKRKEEWGLELTTHFLEYASRNPYQYGKSFFSNHITLIPT